MTWSRLMTDYSTNHILLTCTMSPEACQTRRDIYLLYIYRIYLFKCYKFRQGPVPVLCVSRSMARRFICSNLLLNAAMNARTPADVEFMVPCCCARDMEKDHCKNITVIVNDNQGFDTKSYKCKTNIKNMPVYCDSSVISIDWKFHWFHQMQRALGEAMASMQLGTNPAHLLQRRWSSSVPPRCKAAEAYFGQNKSLNYCHHRDYWNDLGFSLCAPHV